MAEAAQTNIPEEQPDGKRVGSSTKVASAGAVGGAGVGVAIVEVLVFLLPLLEPVSGSLTIIVAALMAGGTALLGGKFTPTDQTRVKTVYEAVQTPAVGTGAEEEIETEVDEVFSR